MKRKKNRCRKSRGIVPCSDAVVSATWTARRTPDSLRILLTGNNDSARFFFVWVEPAATKKSLDTAIIMDKSYDLMENSVM